jgi:hypothetical protein
MLFLHSGSVPHFHAGEIGVVLLAATAMIMLAWRYARKG